ncbi:hypothetical protein NGF19_10610 [Streptomyces sp. RY43-2]|uniref:Lipoprotein n=1 Tax=Streptomyces macrolidinus TaxID=2952607 RepID=A0ABT0ZBV2_9ACTN|nr:hypothetical protein [Streptomyces macrolidinus]MCN9241235.1 hypothetical protein [Streptomyces macrolidinus]
MPVRSARTQLLAATVLVIAATAGLTAGCQDGRGVRDEGPPVVSRSLGTTGGPCGDGVSQRSFCAASTAQ